MTGRNLTMRARGWVGAFVICLMFWGSVVILGYLITTN